VETLSDTLKMHTTAKHTTKGIFFARNPGISEALEDIIKCNEK
jgi:uncharacterized lipoprotein YajG